MTPKSPKFFHSLRAFLFVLKREKFFYILGITLVILLGGATSLYLLEHRVNRAVDSLGDAIYWAIISMTTTGYGDITPSTPAGRVIAAMVVVSGLLLLSLVTATVASVFVEKKIREGKGLETVKFRDHVVLCGWNNHAEEVIEGLLRSMPVKKLSLVLVNELSEEEVETLKYKYQPHDFKFLRGDFAHEDVLARANIAQARSAIILADTSGQHSLEKADERTIIGTLAIKSLAPEVETCAELLNPENRQHLRRASVDEIVVRGEHIGNLIASATASPGLPRVIFSLLSPEEENNLWKVEIPSRFIGKTVADLSAYFKKEHKALLIALLRERKGLALESILTDDYSAIDQFIKRKFEEAEKDYLGKKDRIVVTLNPADDVILAEDDSAVVIARKRP
ncbi:MAG: NAD-binding protein [Deltaproteobacteria bacterium]|nr:NAD-binding protein [Deltaproteobacteria bacterium]